MAEQLDQAISLVGSRVALVAGPGLGAQFLERVRKIVHSRDPFALLVAAMTDSGLGSIPALACAVTERGGVRVLVRGAAKVLVKRRGGGSETISARGVSTWHEQVFTEVEELVLVTANGPGATTSLVLFPDAGASRPPRVRSASAPVVTAPEPAGPPAAAPAQDEYRVGDRPAAAGQAPAHLRASSDAADDDSMDFRHLVEDTRYRGVEAAAVRPPIEDEAPDADLIELPADFPTPDATPPAVGAPGRGDHDGNTISLAELRSAVADSEPTNAVPTVVPTPVGGPSVQAVQCPSGHSNPPATIACRACGETIVDRITSLVPRPTLGHLAFSHGQLVDLDGPLLLGRRPTLSAAEAARADAPRVVAIPDPDQSLSRTHAEIRVDGWSVLLLDRGSMNGTTVRAPREEPQRLRAQEPCLIVPGTWVDLGDSVSFCYELPSGAR